MKIFLAPVKIKSKKFIGIYLPVTEIFLNIVDRLGAQFDEKRSVWLLEYSSQNFQRVKDLFKDQVSVYFFKTAIKYSEVRDALEIGLSSDTRLKIHRYEHWLRQRRYGESTIRTYMNCMLVFFRFMHHKPIHKIENGDITQFNMSYILRFKLSSSYQSQFINALKLFYSTVQNHQIQLDTLLRPRKEKKLPNVLSKAEVTKLLQVTKNKKQKTIICLIYSCGLRSSEVLNLRPHDIDADRGLIFIRQSKGMKDRVVPLSPKILAMLRDYYKEYLPKAYLFPGETEGKSYSARSLQQIISRSAKAAGIHKPVSPHWLRHSAATHLLESGTDLRYIQEILGHKSSRTTEIYTHVSDINIRKIKSPFDDLDI